MRKKIPQKEYFFKSKTKLFLEGCSFDKLDSILELEFANLFLFRMKT